MVMRLGVRVVRGTHWKWDDQDGGEGFVGTVVELPATSPKTAIVQWDSKPAMNYRAGYNDRYDLKVYDSGPSGVKHSQRCSCCDEEEIFGIMWTCCACMNVNLCTTCYMADAHNIDHPFKRYTTPELNPVILGPRRNSRKLEAYGIFENAVVRRGKDWIWGNQDGDGQGRVFRIQGWVDESRRSVVRIEWRNSRSTNVYRVGHRGKADLHAVQPSKGWSYYVDHLPNYGEELIGQRAPMFALGESVRVDDNIVRVQNLAEHHGGWNVGMQKYIGEIGNVHRITDKNDVRILFNDSQKWTYNPKALTKVFRRSEKVMVTEDLETLKEFHGDEIAFFRQLCGKHGQIWAVPDRDSSLYLVKFVSNNNNTNSNQQQQSDTHFIHSNCLYLVDVGNPTTNVLMDEPMAAAASSSRATGVVPNQRFVHPLGAVTQESEEDIDSQRMYVDVVAAEPSAEEVAHYFDCIEKGMDAEVYDYLKRYPQLADAEFDGDKPLLRAVRFERVEMLNFLNHFNVKAIVYDAEGDTAAHVAVRNNSCDVLHLFATKPYWVKLINERQYGQNSDRLTPLHLAVKLGHLDCIEILMQNKNVLCNVKNDEGDTPLHTAMDFAKENVAEYLISCPNVDANTFNDNGHNALHFACIKGQLKLVQKILTRRPELINVPNRFGFAPLHLSVFHARDNVVQFFLTQSFCNKNARIMKNRDYNSWTSLHLAVHKMQPSIIEAFVEGGAELNLTEDGKMCTPLHFAVDNLLQRGCTLTPERLLELQQVENRNDLKINNLLRLCCDCPPMAVCCYLLGSGADPSIKNKSDLTPFDLLTGEMKRLTVVFRSFMHLHATHSEQSQKATAVSSKSKNDVEGELCQLCNESRANVRFEPCNHILYCTNCIRVAASQIRKCIRCNADVVSKVGPAGEIRPKSVSNDPHGSGSELCCIICFEKPKSWMAPRCGHALCRTCCQNVKECPLCRQPMVDLRPVFL